MPKSDDFPDAWRLETHDPKSNAGVNLSVAYDLVKESWEANQARLLADPDCWVDADWGHPHIGLLGPDEKLAPDKRLATSIQNLQSMQARLAAVDPSLHVRQSGLRRFAEHVLQSELEAADCKLSWEYTSEGNMLLLIVPR